MIAPMRAELANSGYTETKTADEVKSAINAEGTTFVVVNSVCGCAAGSARPAAMAAAKSAVRPSIWWRSTMCTNSPFLNNAIEGDDGGNGCIIPRASFTASTSFPAKTVIILVGFTAEMIAGNLLSAFEEHCK